MYTTVTPLYYSKYPYFMILFFNFIFALISTTFISDPNDFISKTFENNQIFTLFINSETTSYNSSEIINIFQKVCQNELNISSCLILDPSSSPEVLSLYEYYNVINDNEYFLPKIKYIENGRVESDYPYHIVDSDDLFFWGENLINFEKILKIEKIGDILNILNTHISLHHKDYFLYTFHTAETDRKNLDLFDKKIASVERKRDNLIFGVEYFREDEEAIETTPFFSVRQFTFSHAQDEWIFRGEIDRMHMTSWPNAKHLIYKYTPISFSSGDYERSGVVGTDVNHYALKGLIDSVDRDKPIGLFIYAKWCKLSDIFLKKIWSNLKTTLSNDFVMISMDGTVNDPPLLNMDFHRFPQVYFIGKSDMVFEYSEHHPEGANDLSLLLSDIRGGNIHMVSDSTIETVTSKIIGWLRRVNSEYSHHGDEL